MSTQQKFDYAQLAKTIDQQVLQAEKDRSISADVVDELKRQGILRAYLPSTLGGMNLSLDEIIDVVFEVSAIDGSTGWIINQSYAMQSFASWLPDATAEVFADPDTIMSGTLWPPGGAVEGDGGWHVSGRWPFGTGVNFAQWSLAGAVELDGDQPRVDPDTGVPALRIVAFPVAETTVHDTWRTTGMRGTGSNDVEVNAILVPEDRCQPIFGSTGRPRSEAMAAAKYGIAPWSSAIFHAACVLGVLEGIHRDLMELAPVKVPNFFENALTDRQTVVGQLAQIRANVEAGKAHIKWAAQVAESAAAAGPMDDEAKVSIQLAASQASRLVREALDWSAQVGGTSVFMEGTSLERRIRDASTVVHHVVLQPSRFVSAGMVMLGQPSDFFAFSL